MFTPKLKTGYFVLEGLNALAASCYFNYLFFYMREHFGFGNAGNLLLTVLHGLVYMSSAWFGGRFAQRQGYFLSLRLGFGTMAGALLFGGGLSALLGFSTATMAGQFLVLIVWTFGMSFTWPTLEALVSERAGPAELLRMLGIYNVVWAGGAALAYFAGGALLERLGWQMLFLFPIGLHAVQLALLGWLEKEGRRVTLATDDDVVKAVPVSMASAPPRAEAKLFLRLAWLANPFAYIAMNALLPVIPQLAVQLHLTPTHAGFFCSVWFFARLAAFVGLWLWPGWHYRFRWLISAYLLMLGSFAVILLVPKLGVIVLAQGLFGLAVGLLYYSSLFYSMDLGDTKGEHGGWHETAIGAGIFAGPAISVTALQLAPQQPHAGTWAVSGALFLGLVLLFWLRRSFPRPSAE